MSHWFRFYGDAVNDPKIIKLSDDIFRAWVNLLCVASKHDGILPATDDIAIILRVKVARAAAIIAELVSFGLLDKTETGFAPHNWNGRQYKSDVSTERVKRFRNGKRNVSETPPEAEQKQTTEQSRADTRDDLKIRTGNFQQAIVKAFADGNSPNLPETSRAGLWLTQGYQEDICLAVIAEIVRKKPSITTLNYFDNAIKEAHASKAPPRQAVPLTAEQVNWDDVLSTYKKIGHWSKWAGPGLDSPACRAPAEMLAKYDLRGAHEGLPAPPVNLRAMQ